MHTPHPLEVITQIDAAVLDLFEDPAALLGADGSIVGHNRAWLAHGFADAAFADGDPIPPARVLAGDVDHVAGVCRRMRSDGWRWYRSRVQVVRGSEGVAAVLVHTDATTERRLLTRMASSPVAHLDLDADGRLLAVNDRWEELRGRPVGAELGHRWLRDTPEEQRDALAALLEGARAFTFDLTTAGRDDRLLQFAVSFEPTFDGGDHIGWQGTAVDCTEQRALEQAAQVDALTGMATRLVFESALARLLSRRPVRPRALLYVDLDGFKAVNDEHGHGVGDVVLRSAALRIREALRPEDLVARHGGDEFAVLLRDGDAASVTGVAERLVTAFREPIVHNGLTLTVGVSVGATVVRDGDDRDAAMARADSAMYAAKRAGGLQVRIFPAA